MNDNELYVPARENRTHYLRGMLHGVWLGWAVLWLLLHLVQSL